MQYLHLNQVENEAHDGDDQHDIALYIDPILIKILLNGQIEQPAEQHPNCRDLQESANDLCTVPTEGHHALLIGCG